MNKTSTRNVIMEFNLEDKIRFQDLAPLLQDMITGISNSISNLNTTLNSLNSKITNLENKVAVLESKVNSGSSGGGSYILPTATTDNLGCIKAGKGLSISEDGMLSISGAESSDSYDIAEDDIMNEIINNMSIGG